METAQPSVSCNWFYGSIVMIMGDVLAVEESVISVAVNDITLLSVLLPVTHNVLSDVEQHIWICHALKIYACFPLCFHLFICCTSSPMNVNPSIVTTTVTLPWTLLLLLLFLEYRQLYFKSYLNLCKKESQVKSKKTAFSQEQSTKSQGKVKKYWLFVDFSWLRAVFSDFTWLSFLQRLMCDKGTIVYNLKPWGGPLPAVLDQEEVYT